MAYLETPRTDAGNATFAANGIDDMSFEKSFVSPKKRPHDLVHQMRSKRGQALRTPSARTALANRPNPTGMRKSGEFTPLLQSITKRNAFQGKENLPTNGVATPAFLKTGYVPRDSPALGNQLGSSFYGSDPSYLAENPVELPQVASSSGQSTPTAHLPKAGQGVLEDQRNLMTLREQENIIDKVEKENFGLKLKIHFLEELLRKSDPNLNQNALKENTDLRVDKVQLQKELAKIRKSLKESERLAESLKQQTRDSYDRIERDQAGQRLQQEVTALRKAQEDRETEIEDLKYQLANDPRDHELGKLHDDIEDLEADVREKQRLIDTKDDELDILNIKLQKAEDMEHQAADSKEQDRKVEELERALQKLQDDVKYKDEQLEDLQDSARDLQDQATRARAEAKEASEEREYADREKQAAIDDLDELRGEMAEKSFSTKGLNRQVEEKANKLDTENHDLRDQIRELQSQLDRRVEESRDYQGALEEEKQDNDFNQRQLQDEIDSLKQAQQESQRTRTSVQGQSEQIRTELQKITDEKELLQSRHDALTVESQGLQRDINNANKQISDLEHDLNEEKQLSLDNERALRDEAKRETDRLSSNVNSLQRQLETERGNQSNQQELWSSERRELQLQKEQAEQRAIGLQRTVEKLQATQGSLSSKETQLQQALESEQQRHRDEQGLLSRQMEDLRKDLDKKRDLLEANRVEMMKVKEQHRTSSRNNDMFNEKIQGLEDEIEVLQSSLEEESEKARADTSAARQEAETVRRQLLSSKQEITRVEGELADARAQIESFRGDLQIGEGSKEQLNNRIRELENQMVRLRNDKQILQDEVSRLQDVQTHAQAEIDTFQLDLRTGRGSQDHLHARIRDLETQLGQLREDKQTLQDNVDNFQIDLRSQHSSSEQLNNRIRDLETQCNRLRNDKQSLRDELAGVNLEMDKLRSSGNAGDNDGSFIRRDLVASRARELEATQKEARLKDDVRALRREIAQLERRVHEAELAKVSTSSPNSSMLGSARKNEVIELRRQLNDAQSQSTNLRKQLRDVERTSRDQVTRSAAEILEQQADANALKDEFQARIADLEIQVSQQHNKIQGDTQFISRLRTRITLLEKELKESRTATITESDMATERADLHRILQETKLEAEDMAHLAMEQSEQLEIREKREEHFKTQLKVVRDECVMRQQKSNALEKELLNLQARYEKLLQEMSMMNELLHDQQEDLKRHVHFVDDTVNDLQVNLRKSGNTGVVNQKHQDELADIKAQLEWMKTKLKRESSQKNALVYEKQYLEKEIETFEACNRINLNMLRRVIPRRSPEDVETDEPQRTLRHAGLAIVSAIRLRNLAHKWAATQERFKPREMPRTRMQEVQPTPVEPSRPQQQAPQKTAGPSASSDNHASRPSQPSKFQVMPKQKPEVNKGQVAPKQKVASQQRQGSAPEAKPKSKSKSALQKQAIEELAATPKLAELRKSLLFERQAATDLLGKHTSSKDFDIKAAEKFVDAMVKTMKSFQGTDAGQDMVPKTPENTDPLSAIPEQTENVTHITQTPQETTEALPDISEDIVTEDAPLHEEQTDSTSPEDRVYTRDDACVTLDIDESTLDMYQWAGRQQKKEAAQDQTKPKERQRDGSGKETQNTNEIEDLDFTVNTEVSDWFHRPESRQDRTQESTHHFTRHSQPEAPISKKEGLKPAVQQKTSSQREKRKSTHDSNTTKSIFAAFENSSSQRQKEKRKAAQQDVSSNLSSLSSIETSQVLGNEPGKTDNSKKFTTSEAVKNEWWGKIKDGSDRPIEGQMKIKWKGYVAFADGHGAEKGMDSREKDEAVKKTMEKLALDKTMARIREEARAFAKEGGSLGKRKFQGKSG